VLGGRIYRGATGGAGELGHTLIGLDLSGRPAPPGKFPQHGSLERLAAGRALDALVADYVKRKPASMLGRMHSEGHEVLGPDAVEAARADDPDAQELVELWAERLGIGVANAINTFDPDEVVIGGGAAQAGELLLEPVRRVAAGYVLPGLGQRTTIRLARHGVRAGVLGAALLAAHELGDTSIGSEQGSGAAESGDGLTGSERASSEVAP
jgi:glucokinase